MGRRGCVSVGEECELGGGVVSVGKECELGGGVV